MFRCYYIASVGLVYLCMVSSIQHILEQHVVTPGQHAHFHLYTDPKATSFGYDWHTTRWS